MARTLYAAMLLSLVLICAAAPHAVAQPKDAKGAKGPAPIVPVTVIAAEQKGFSDAIEALGTTRANETVTLTAKLSEKVYEILFTDGQTVKKDYTLVVLDKTEEVADLAAAEASAAEARSAYNRSRDLQKQQIVSRANFEEKQAQLRQAEAQIQAIKSRIADTEIKAPFDGILGLRNVSVGALVQPGDAITTIDDLSQMKVDFDVPAIYLQQLKSGLNIIGTVEGFGDRHFEGTVSTIDTQVDSVTRAVKVRAIVPNADLALKPGLLMNVTLDLNPRQSLVVPEGAVVQQRDTSYVFIIADNNGKTAAKRVDVKRGARRLGEVEILEGLEAGQQVITSGLMSISDGAEVKVQEAAVNKGGK